MSQTTDHEALMREKFEHYQHHVQGAGAVQQFRFKEGFEFGYQAALASLPRMTEGEIAQIIKEHAQCKLDFFDSQLRQPYLANPDDIARALIAAFPHLERKE